MRNMLSRFVVALLLIVPFAAHAQQAGIAGCDRGNASSQSAGTVVPLGGPYVPVADSAVTLNTGILAYKECVLRVLVNRQATAGLAQASAETITQFNTGLDGEPYFSRDMGAENLTITDDRYSRNISNGTLSRFNSALQDPVKRAIAKGYLQERDPTNAFVCDYDGDLQQAISGRTPENFWKAMDALTHDQACNAFGAFQIGDDALSYDAAYEVYKNTTKLGWGQGVYDKYTLDENGRRITQTPGAIILSNGIQAIQSGFERLKLADDIGQMVSGLYAGVSNQVIAGSKGLAGLTQSLGGQPSYLNQVVGGATQDLTNATNNATIGALQEALRVEQQYNSVASAIATLFTQNIASLRSKETTCFTSVIPNAVCVPGTIADNKCTSTSGGQLTIAPQTIFSQRLIDVNIRPLATAIATNINTSNATITRIQQLIGSLSGTPTTAMQQAALTQLAALRPHTGNDVAALQRDQQTINTNMITLQSDTATKWGDDPNKKIGWCNVNNTEVTSAWNACWSGNASACITP